MDPKWDILVGIHGIKNNAFLKDLAHKVRRGQKGRILDGNGSAGDIAFGYASRFVDPQAAAAYNHRGPKPKRDVIINEDEATWVWNVFTWYAGGKSIGWIARELTRLKVSKGAKGTVEKWHHHVVRRMLANTKYIGQWTWGRTQTRRASSGKKKQVAVPENEVLVRERPNLRIINDALWAKVQARLKKAHESYGYRAGQKPHGMQKQHYTVLYPKSLLGGLLFCNTCGARLVQQTGGSDIYHGCPNHRNGTCLQTTRVPKILAEREILGMLQTRLVANADWVATAK